MREMYDMAFNFIKGRSESQDENSLIIKIETFEKTKEYGTRIK
jgi:hypothetical protein